MAHPSLIADQPFDPGIGGQFVCIAQGYPMFDSRTVLVNFLNNRQKSHVKTHHSIFSMVHDPRDLLWMQSGVERMQNPATAADTEIQFQMSVAIPRQSGNTVALIDLPAVECVGNLP